MKAIGFLKPVRVEWLNITVEELIKGKEKNEIRDVLKRIVSNYYKSEDTIRKILAILMSTWVNAPEKNMCLRDRGVDLFKIANPDEKIALHFGMLMVTYPIFNDVVFIIGKAFYLENRFKLEYLKKRIFEKWGERETLRFSIDKIIKTLKDWELIVSKNSGVYEPGTKVTITNKDIKAFLIACYLKANGRSYIDIDEIENLYSFFPFNISVNLNELMNVDSLNVNKIDSVITVAVNKL
ncbi:hypothetical protein [Caldicellulosiruptor naganoensis]|uniref:VrlQ n=1 Tax=Caldicellulosiruptor naganoensis TaxID=29324 RepID=A0ABY7BF84_9FIRM|nr:hypothetical protein [Caldicellulosiruptor naganoensis]WAM31027.1 VrlQ [Caldicellulosiruptor naganoensis]